MCKNPGKAKCCLCFLPLWPVNEQRGSQYSFRSVVVYNTLTAKARKVVNQQMAVASNLAFRNFYLIHFLSPWLEVLKRMNWVLLTNKTNTFNIYQVFLVKKALLGGLCLNWMVPASPLCLWKACPPWSHEALQGQLDASCNTHFQMMGTYFFMPGLAFDVF